MARMAGLSEHTAGNTGEETLDGGDGGASRVHDTVGEDGLNGREKSNIDSQTTLEDAGGHLACD